MSSNDNQETNSISAPLVFQCVKCKVIVGDTFCMQSSNEALQSVTLTAASNIKRSHDIFTSKSGVDVGSTYFSFTCSGCDHALGNYYLTTSKDLDDLRERFTIFIANVTSYELGKAEHGKMPEPQDQRSGAGGSVGSVQGDGTDAAEGIPSAASMHEEIIKIQHVMLDHGLRLSVLEQTVASKKRSRDT